MVDRPMINIPMLRFTSMEITQEVSALSLSKINRLGGFLWERVKIINFGHLVTPMCDPMITHQHSNSHIFDSFSSLCAVVTFLHTAGNHVVDMSTVNLPENAGK